MRNPISLACLVFAVLFGLTGLVQAQDEASLTVSNGTIYPGGSTEVNVLMSSAREVGGLDLALRFDSAVVRFVDASNGSIAEDALMASNEIEPGRVLVGLADVNGLSGDGPVVTLTFQAIGEVGARTAISVESARAYHYETLDEITVRTGDGSLTVVAETPPTPVPVEETPAAVDNTLVIVMSAMCCLLGIVVLVAGGLALLWYSRRR